jgi:hypothetical protein
MTTKNIVSVDLFRTTFQTLNRLHGVEIKYKGNVSFYLYLYWNIFY